jgi:uncharacterized membrane protein
MSHNPQIRLELSPADRLIEILALSCMLAVWGFTIFSYKSLPASIPIHFDLNGNIDGWGDRNSIFLLPFISSVLYGGMSILNRFPELYNYPRPIDPENKMKQYRLATRLIRLLKFFIQLFFILCIIEVILGARQEALPFKQWLIPLLISFLMVPTVLYVIAASKK